ncbi:class I SAM-dependent methyltransferase [Amycolatopsis sp. NPDC059021]|uniref:class I SAM-dependent methyltransferase n=1 Tax=Amycolatopsis sp. NPDC059021 TaxID=3346704 RepID=UPI0036725B66
MSGDTWEWDASLYSGSAAYYARGRLAYPKALVDALVSELRLDGSGRLLDVGCGPGSLTLPLAGLFEEAIGLDADRDMLDQAERSAAEAGIRTARWLRLRAEELPAGLGTFRLVTFAQSFHWLDRPKVAAVVRGMLADGGVCAHVHATTHQGVESDAELPHPRPPHSAIGALVREYLGPVRRAGRGCLPQGTASGEDEIYRAAGFTGPRRIEIPGRVVTRVTEDLVAAVFSLSSSAPHLFGDDRAEFETELRRLLHRASPSGVFSEQTHDIAVGLWQP